MRKRAAAIATPFFAGFVFMVSGTTEAFARDGLNVPPDRLPPPGLCRVWFPDRPPDRQPPSAPCDVLEANIPPGAVLLDGGPGDDGLYVSGNNAGLPPDAVPDPALGGSPRASSGGGQRYCREFQREIVIGGQREQAYGVACQQEDGSWKIGR